MRRRYLIAYDVADDKRRAAVFKTLMGVGDHVQFSVFLAELNDREHAELTGALHQLIHHKEDQVLLVDLGSAQHDPETKIQCLGTRYEPSVRILVV